MSRFVLAGCISLLLLTACSGPKNKLEKCHKAQEYQTATIGPRVRVPSDLEPLKAENRLELPFGETRTDPTAKGDPCLIEPPDYQDRDAN
jgi:uncharacterized lipoprotein